jgi:hypothetical protein
LEKSIMSSGGGATNPDRCRYADDDETGATYDKQQAGGKRFTLCLHFNSKVKANNVYLLDKYANNVNFPR